MMYAVTALLSIEEFPDNLLSCKGSIGDIEDPTTVDGQ